MQRCLRAERDGMDALGRLVSQLESLGALLEAADDAWNDGFQNEWGALEQVLAAALDRGAATIDDAELALIDRAVARLQALVDERLARLPRATGDLLEELLSEEWTAHVRRLIEEAILDSTKPRPRFELNLFDVTVEREEQVVLIEDALDASDARAQRVPLAEFVEALRRDPA